MSAEILRKAAALMRERAEAATPGPWDSQWPTTGESWVFGSDSTDICLTYLADDPDTEHIASWHPAVALVVADWLDFMAGFREEVDGTGGAGHPIPGEDRALAVARAYLGGDA